MEDNNAKIHLKVGEIEISIEGSPDYVKEQYNQMAKDLNLHQNLQGKSNEKEKTKARKSTKTQKTKKTESQKGTIESAKEDFGEWLKDLPKGLKNSDKILLAGYFNQMSSENSSFRVRDVNNILKNQGIKINNPSSMVNNLVKNQNILKEVSREGRQKYFQLTKEGEKYIKDFLKAKNK